METIIARKGFATAGFFAVALSAAATTVLSGTSSVAYAAPPRPNVVAQWIDVELDEIAAHRTSPPRASRALALASAAMLEATDAPNGQQSAAVAGAAATVLAYLFPDRAARFDELTRDARPRKALLRGRAIGTRVVARARTDGSDAVFSGTVPVGPGLHVLATLNTAQADAFIACWDAKFTDWSERPVTAIRREVDPTWSPHITTPQFPSYVSGHSTTSGAASEVLARAFPGSASKLRAWAEEAAVSRLYGGIHFRSDNEAGLALGKRVAAAAIAAYRLAPLSRD